MNLNKFWSKKVSDWKIFCVNKRLFPYTFKRHKVVKSARLHISSKAKTPKLNPSVANLSRNWSLFCPKDFILYIIPLMILCTQSTYYHLTHYSDCLYPHLPLSGFHIGWIRWGLCCRGFLQRLPWFSPWVAVVLYKGCRGFLHFLGKQSQLLLCPTQVELGLSRQSGVRQLSYINWHQIYITQSLQHALFQTYSNWRLQYRS